VSSRRLGLVHNELRFGGPFCKTATSTIYVVRLFSKEICMVQSVQRTHLMSTVYASPVTQLCFAIIKCCLIFNFLDEVFIQHI